VINHEIFSDPYQAPGSHAIFSFSTTRRKYLDSILQTHLRRSGFFTVSTASTSILISRFFCSCGGILRVAGRCSRKGWIVDVRAKVSIRKSRANEKIIGELAVMLRLDAE